LKITTNHWQSVAKSSGSFKMSSPLFHFGGKTHNLIKQLLTPSNDIITSTHVRFMQARSAAQVSTRENANNHVALMKTWACE
jgi:hypothetical protein